MDERSRVSEGEELSMRIAFEERLRDHIAKTMGFDAGVVDRLARRWAKEKVDAALEGRVVSPQRFAESVTEEILGEREKEGDRGT